MQGLKVSKFQFDSLGRIKMDMGASFEGLDLNFDFNTGVDGMNPIKVIQYNTIAVQDTFIFRLG